MRFRLLSAAGVLARAPCCVLYCVGLLLSCKPIDLRAALLKRAAASQEVRHDCYGTPEYPTAQMRLPAAPKMRGGLELKMLIKLRPKGTNQRQYLSRACVRPSETKQRRFRARC